MEWAQMSINGWMDKEDVVYMYNGILLGNQKEWNLAICNNVDGISVYYAKYQMISLYVELRNIDEHRGREGKVR